MARRKATAKAAEHDAQGLPDLTPQQQAFVSGLLAGLTGAEAYRAAYDCKNWSQNAVWVEASRMRSNPKIALWLAAAREAHLGNSVVSLAQHIARLDALKERCIAEGNLGAAVQAEQLIGKASGHYVERIAEVQLDPMSTLRELREVAPELAEAAAKHYGLDLCDVNNATGPAKPH